jgi:hypothetical protein
MLSYLLNSANGMLTKHWEMMCARLGFMVGYATANMEKNEMNFVSKKKPGFQGR